MMVAVILASFYLSADSTAVNITVRCYSLSLYLSIWLSLSQSDILVFSPTHKFLAHSESASAA